MTDPRLPDIGAHPLNTMDTESIETAAASIAALGRVVGQNGAQAVTAWAPISSAYQGPGDAELIAAMAPVSTLSTEVSTRTASVARSLRTLKQTADEIKATMTTLKADLVDLRADVAAFEPTQPTGGRVPHGAVRTDWWDDPALEAENQRIIKGLNDCVERMHEAERVCINEIRALHNLSPLTAGEGSYADGHYGVDEIPHEAETPWGTAEPDDEDCAEAAGSWVVNAGKDLAGLVGMQWDSDGDFSWTLDNFTETWTGMAVLITRNPETGEWFDWGAAGDAWLGAGKDFLAWDRWSENPQGAFTDVVLNVGTSFIAGAGAATKIAKVGKLGRRGDVDVDVDVDIDAGDFAVPRIDVDSDLDLDIDFGDLDLDIDVPADRPDVPADRPDVPADRPDVPADRPDVPVDRPDVTGDRVDVPQDGADTPGDHADGAGSDDTPAADVDRDAVDPRTAGRTPNEDVVFQPSQDYVDAVDARTDAVEVRRDAVAERRDAIARLDELGMPVSDKDLLKGNITASMNRLEASVLDDPDLTPDEAAERLNAIDDMRTAAWDERASYTAQANASERLGDAAARDAIRSQGADVVVDGAGASAGQFDQVGLTHDGRTLIVAEAKGGSAELSARGRVLPDGTRAAQGSTLYFNDVFRVDPTLQRYLAENPDVAHGLADGTIDVRYQLVKADGSGSVQIEDLALDPEALDLTLPVPVG
ncbi:hypothetical protein ACPW96_06435 [Micromonospora sp. DT81.3]|uniref:hypothetical protein n=1 Tax=Micromonospora sp. DT81.3 TaxID=3416523 RepID=UPI003CEA0E59